MFPLIVSLLLASAQTPPPATQPRPPAPSTQKPPATAPRQPATPPRRTTPASGSATLQVRVTDRSGTPIMEAEVTAEGPSSRAGTTDPTGLVTLRTMLPGTYRVRAERMGSITLEKEIVVRTGAPITADFALSHAPPIEDRPSQPPPAAAPAPAPAAPPPSAVTLTPGRPEMLSISNLAEKSLSGREPVKTVPIGCSGASRAQLLVVREAVPMATHADTDEMVYLVAGEATLTMGGKDQAMTPSWFSLVPRGTPYSITRKGRNPAVLLTMVSGEPCSVATP